MADPVKAAQVGAYLQLLKQGFAWKAKNEERFAQALAKEIEVPLSYVLDQLRSASQPTDLLPVTKEAVASQQAVADTFHDAGFLPQKIKVGSLWDDRYNALLG
ncbi:hypothetical protein [Sphingobium limneticum]|uniref:hypothetical protein n=1 Tax=Sphingobium limneticum TaxID=1007511 RepID=UPI001FE6143C|nr:hypothetical protein [Sphingobium limneticum]